MKTFRLLTYIEDNSDEASSDQSETVGRDKEVGDGHIVTYIYCRIHKSFKYKNISLFFVVNVVVVEGIRFFFEVVVSLICKLFFFRISIR